MRVFLAALLLAPVFAFAQSGFTGTWRFDTKAVQSTLKHTYLLKTGTFRCTSCEPKIEVKADGRDYPVAGSPYFDSVNVKALDDSAVEIVHKKAGKIFETRNIRALPNGNTLATERTLVSQSGRQGNMKYTSTRVGSAPERVSGITGTWQAGKLEDVSASIMTFTLKASGTELSMSDPFGNSYTAQLDGKDYPYKGDPGITSVSLIQVDANTIQETDKRDGKVVYINTMAIAPDGKTMTLTVDDKLRNARTKYTAQRQ